jgi:hypothetical protein
VDVTGISPTVNTVLTVYPKGATKPTASSVNVGKGEALSNSVVVGVGTDGKIDVHNLVGMSPSAVTRLVTSARLLRGGLLHALAWSSASARTRSV